MFSSLNNCISFNCPWEAFFLELYSCHSLICIPVFPSFSNYHILDERQDYRWNHSKAGGKVRLLHILHKTHLLLNFRRRKVETVQVCDTANPSICRSEPFLQNLISSSGFPSSICAADYSYLFTCPCRSASYLFHLMNFNSTPVELETHIKLQIVYRPFMSH